MSGMGTYRHTQQGPWSWLCNLLAAVCLVTAVFVPALAPQIAMLAAGLFLLLLGATIGHLTVEDEGDWLAVRFGPLSLFRRRIRYDHILQVEPARTSFLDGWGIHWSPWGGWLWNIWGYDCVILRLKRGTLRIGTDDLTGLVEFLRTRMAEDR